MKSPLNLTKALFILGLLLFQAFGGVIDRPYVGFWNSAHHGGVQALETQTGAFWSNPGAMNLKQSQRLETTVYHLGAESGASQSWVMPAGQFSTLGLAFSAHPISEFQRQEIRAGFGVRPIPSLSLGMIGVSQFVQDSIFMDFNAGAQYSLTEYFRGGLQVQQITERLSHSIDSTSQRLYGAGFVYYPLYNQSQRDFLLHLDWESRYLKIKEDRYTVGASYVLGPRENLRLSGAISRIDLDSIQPISSSLGIQVQEVFFKSLLSFHYSVSQIPISDIDGEPMKHQIGVGVQLYPKQDLTPPRAQVNMSRSLLDFSSKDTTLHRAFFILNAQDNSNQFKNWHLVISKLDSGMNPIEVIKSFNGQGQPPKQILWAGRNNSGERLLPGFYSYRLIVVDKESNHTASSWQFFEIK